MKFKEFTGKIKEATNKAKTWVVEHKDQIIRCTVGGIILTIAVADRLIPAVRAHNDAKKEREIENSVYDHSLGCRWLLKRPMRSEEQIIFEKRKQDGENTGEILRSMKILK